MTNVKPVRLSKKEIHGVAPLEWIERLEKEINTHRKTPEPADSWKRICAFCEDERGLIASLYRGARPPADEAIKAAALIKSLRAVNRQMHELFKRIPDRFSMLPGLNAILIQHVKYTFAAPEDHHGKKHSALEPFGAFICDAFVIPSILYPQYVPQMPTRADCLNIIRCAVEATEYGDAPKPDFKNTHVSTLKKFIETSGIKEFMEPWVKPACNGTAVHGRLALTSEGDLAEVLGLLPYRLEGRK